MAKLILKIGEWAGVKFAHRIIVISVQIASDIARKYKRNDCVLIPNGVGQPLQCHSDDFLTKHNLTKGKYILSVGRFVPEKGFTYLIRSFRKSGLSKTFKLVIAGDADHDTIYSTRLKELAKEEDIILTGFINGENLAQIYSNAGLFILPSFYEGLPITLLEAMSYNLDILASDIGANKEINLPENCYFKTGDEADLTLQLKRKADSIFEEKIYNMKRYDWDKIALQTLYTYKSVLGINIIKPYVPEEVLEKYSATFVS